MDVQQYSRSRVLAVWAAAALPMGALAWIVAPAIAGQHSLVPVLIGCLCAGLIWQFVLVVVLVARERPSSFRDALWLRPPTSPGGRRGGPVWLWALPFAVGFGALQLVPLELPSVRSHDFGAYLGSPDGAAELHHNWGLFALTVVLFTFNTFLGEELLFRGLLLPRMRGAFGRADWVVNGALMGVYHLHQPWSIPSSVVAGLLMAYPTKRFRSAWMGIIVHSTQSVILTAVIFGLVLR